MAIRCGAGDSSKIHHSHSDQIIIDVRMPLLLFNRDVHLAIPFLDVRLQHVQYSLRRVGGVRFPHTGSTGGINSYCMG